MTPKVSISQIRKNLVSGTTTCQKIVQDFINRIEEKKKINAFEQQLDVFYNDKPVVDDIDYRDQTLYEYLDPGQYTVSVRGNLTGNDIVTSNIQFKPDRIYSIYIIGNPPNIELLQSVDGNTYACPQ